MKIHNTGDAQVKPSIVMLVYGQGGVGKTTFTATAPKPILADCENGAKYFGLRGIKIDVANINTWRDIEEFYTLVKNSAYETVIIDPIGELMEKLKTSIIAQKEKKFVMNDGSLTMAGWGEMKDRMRRVIKTIRDLNKHLIIVAHLAEKDDEGRIVKRPKVETKLSEELVAMVDVAGFMEIIKTQNESGEYSDKRVIRVSPSDKYESKDRTGQLGSVIEPDFQKIIDACQGNAVFAWSSAKAKEVAESVGSNGTANPTSANNTTTEAPKEKTGMAEEKFLETLAEVKTVNDVERLEKRLLKIDSAKTLSDTQKAQLKLAHESQIAILKAPNVEKEELY